MGEGGGRGARAGADLTHGRTAGVLFSDWLLREVYRPLGERGERACCVESCVEFVNSTAHILASLVPHTIATAVLSGSWHSPSVTLPPRTDMLVLNSPSSTSDGTAPPTAASQPSTRAGLYEGDSLPSAPNSHSPLPWSTGALLRGAIPTGEKEKCNPYRGRRRVSGSLTDVI